MSSVPWKTQINFASALLLHSCVTVILKESFNVLVICTRLWFRWWVLRRPNPRTIATDQIRTSVVLDAYTSICSRDVEGDLAELYFTNTGFALLALSLTSSVVMNIMLSSILLNSVVIATFGIAFLASLAVGERELALPILALRRAGRFIWSDTPFVNFFSLIYIATVLKGHSELRLQDYVTFRSIAVLELIFMKAKLAASTPAKQEQLIRQLVASEWIVVNAVGSAPYDNGATKLIIYEQNLGPDHLSNTFTEPLRNDMIPFTTAQRLSVMLFKTSVGFHLGCLRGPLGPASVPLPAVGFYVDQPDHGWRIYRLSDEVMILSDRLVESPRDNWYGKLIVKMHGVLLRQLGKVRVIYLLQKKGASHGKEITWHSNVNLVTGVASKWLDGEFRPANAVERCIIAG